MHAQASTGMALTETLDEATVGSADLEWQDLLQTGFSPLSQFHNTQEDR